MLIGLVAACWAAATGHALLVRVKHNQPTLHAGLAGLRRRVPLRQP